MLERWFQIHERQSSIRSEVLGGITTFVTMAYIVIINPAIMSFAGIPLGAGTTATILTAAFGTLLMGLYANRPIAVAPYMGENAFLAFGLATLGISWQLRLGSVFISGLLLVILTLLGLRSWLAQAISPSMKYSFATGIGFFLAFIGLYETGIVTSFVTGVPAKSLMSPGSPLLNAPEIPVKIGDWHQPTTILSLLGFLLMILLMIRKIPGGILIGIGITAVTGMFFGLGSAPEGWFSIPFSGNASLAPTWMAMDLRDLFQWSFFPIFITLFLMCFLDTLGTLVGLGASSGILDKEGNFPEVEKPMMVDAVTNLFAASVGTSTSGAYIESAAGIREGARTGLAAVVTAIAFLLTLFFTPLIESLQKLSFAYAPALMAIGAMMISSVRRIDFDDLTEAIPAFASIAMMIFTYNIANGLTSGLVLYPILKIAAGRWKELHAGSLILGGLCLTYYLFGLPH